MCYTAFIVKKQEDKGFEKIIKDELETKMIENSDGFASLKLSKNFEIKEYIRNVDYLLASKMLNNFDCYNLFHFRLATAGKKNKRNVHLWKRNEWFFSHNGSVGLIENTSFSDSYIFFRLLSQDLKNLKNEKKVVAKLEKWIDKAGLIGRGFLFDIDAKKVYIFGDVNVYSYNDYFIISSSKLSFKKKIRRFGTEFCLSYKEVLKKEINGYYVYDLQKDTLKKIKDRDYYFYNYNRLYSI